MRNSTVHSEGDALPSPPAALKYMVGAAALFIAGCSAYFSVLGLGLLFTGAAATVMIMAASLEIGKLVAASFLYAYWRQINRALRFYLFVAVVVLIGITSLGNYGYLARAFERTHTEITLQEQQIAELEREIADTQKQIDASRGQFGKVTDAGRADITSAQQRITELQTALEQSLARVQERRKTAQDRRDSDLQTEAQKLTERTEVLKKGIAQEETAIAELNQRVAVLDRAVDAYTKQGGPGFFKEDSIKKGAELREKQQNERDSIAARIAEHSARLAQLRADHSKETASSERAVASVREQFAQEAARLDKEEQDLRKQNGSTLSQAQAQLAALQLKGQSVQTTSDAQIDAMYARVRACNQEIHQLRLEIAGADIGPYRFVARAFDASADDVVKWLMLTLVLVFDPLAVSLAVGFNVAILRDRIRRHQQVASQSPSMIAETETPMAGSERGRSRLTVGLNLLLVVLGVGTLAFGAYWGSNVWRSRTLTNHSTLIPAESFAVVTMRPTELQRTGENSVADWLEKVAGKPVADSLEQFIQGGFDPASDIYVFAKFPSDGAATTQERPVMIGGFVARVTDPVKAEVSLARLAGQFTRSLGGANPAVPQPTQNRAMIRHGDGRYLDPEGGFFTFALVDGAAIVMVEFEGNPQAPCVEKEIRNSLARPESKALASSQSNGELPARALTQGGPITIWFDSDKFFDNIPKNPTAQARYQQLERHLGFDLVLKVRPSSGDLLNIVADYAYRGDRFKDRQQPRALDVLASLGASDGAGISGRLMDRCADTLDYDSLIERLRVLLGNSKQGAEEVVVEKSYASARDAQFVLTARYDPQAGQPLVAAVQSLLP